MHMLKIIDFVSRVWGKNMLAYDKFCTQVSGITHIDYIDIIVSINQHYTVAKQPTIWPYV